MAWRRHKTHSFLNQTGPESRDAMARWDDDLMQILNSVAALRCAVTAPWQECGDELAEREQQMAKVCQRESLASGRRRSSP